MNLNNLLKLIHKGILSNSLIESSEIQHIVAGAPINEENLEEIKVSMPFITVPIILPQNSILLIKDLPINFLMAQSILLGDKTNLYSFKIKNRRQKFFSEKEVMEEIAQYYVISDITKETISSLENLLFTFPFKLLPVISNLELYLRETRNLNLFKLHLVNSNKIKLFIPNINIKHLKMAQLMKTPVPSLILGSFLRDTKIRYDEQDKIANLLKPYTRTRKDLMWLHKEGNLAFKDSRRVISIEISKEQIIRKIENFPNVKKYLEDIPEYMNYTIGKKTGEIPLPLWINKSDASFVKIEDLDNFREITGVNLKLERNELDKVYLHDSRGKRAHFEGYYLDKFIQRYINELFDSEILYSKKKELILKIFFVKSIKNITYQHEISKQSKIEFENLIEENFKIIKDIMIEYANNPKKGEIESLLDSFCISAASRLLLAHQEYKHNNNKKELFVKSLKVLKKLRKTAKVPIFNPKKSYFFFQVFLSVLVCYREINPKKTAEIKNYLSSLRINSSPSIEIKVMKVTERVVYDLIILHTLAKKEHSKIMLIEKNSNVSELYPPKVSISTYEPMHRKFVKINEKEITQLYPSLANKIIKELKNYKGDLSLKKSIVINEKPVPIRDEFINTYESYEDYNLIRKNKYFSILVEKPRN